MGGDKLDRTTPFCAVSESFVICADSAVAAKHKTIARTKIQNGKRVIYKSSIRIALRQPNTHSSSAWTSLSSNVVTSPLHFDRHAHGSSIGVKGSRPAKLDDVPFCFHDRFSQQAPCLPMPTTVRKSMSGIG